ncbi:MAG: zinc-binding dehydrogenase [candidate division WOR-3 bacterium]|nr:zinc-binding dehydrogenase [Candidatus Bathyarchaeota archaeon]
MEAFRIVFPSPNKVNIERFSIEEPSENEVLIETIATLISTGTELTAFSGDFPERSAWSAYVMYPFIPGYSSVGEVVKCGSKVKDFKVGDIVAATTPHATHAVVRSEHLIKVPENISLEDACFHTIAAGVINSVRLAKVSLGESVAVVGLGILGQMVVMFSRMAGAYPVIALDIAEDRLKIAKSSGATYTLCVDNWSNTRERIRQITKGRMADKVFEVTGNPNVIPEAITLTRNLGYFIVLSSPRGKTLMDFHDEVNKPSRVIIGTHFTSQPECETLNNPWTRRRNAELYFDLLSAGYLKINHLITHKYSWHEAEKAYKMLMEDRTKAIGVILRFKSYI